MDCMFVFSQNYYMEILKPSVTVLGGWAFGTCLGHEHRALTNAISALVKETQDNLLAPPSNVRTWGHNSCL